jgi:serine/threonine protein kinase
MELVIMCSISHPSLLSASFRPRFGTTKELFVVSPLARSDLRRYLAKETNGKGVRNNPPLLKLWTTQLCQAVHVLHYYDIIHGDIKPANVLVMDEEQPPRVLLGDFSSALFLPTAGERRLTFYSNTVTHRSLEEFMSKLMPSRYSWTGKPQDMWALACTLYELGHGSRLIEYVPTDAQDDGRSTKTCCHVIRQILALLERDPDAHTSPMFVDACAYVASGDDDDASHVQQHPGVVDVGGYGDLLRSLLRLDPGKRATAQHLVTRDSYVSDTTMERGQLLRVRSEGVIEAWVHPIPSSIPVAFANSIYAKIVVVAHLPAPQTQRIALIIAALMTHTTVHDLKAGEIQCVMRVLNAIGMRLL